MGLQPTKAADNVYCKARKEAAKYNDRLNSREGASELLGVSVSTLTDYELSITKIVPVDRVLAMAELYNAPEIKNHYCTQECPIGKSTVHKLEVMEFDRLALTLIAALRNISNVKESIIDIAADGVISDKEKPKLKEVLGMLDGIVIHTQELRMWAEKNLK